MRDDLLAEAMRAHLKNRRAVLFGGDGSAWFAMRYRQKHPRATEKQMREAVALWKSGNVSQIDPSAGAEFLAERREAMRDEQ